MYFVHAISALYEEVEIRNQKKTVYHNCRSPRILAIPWVQCLRPKIPRLPTIQVRSQRHELHSRHPPVLYSKCSGELATERVLVTLHWSELSWSRALCACVVDVPPPTTAGRPYTALDQS